MSQLPLIKTLSQNLIFLILYLMYLCFPLLLQEPYIGKATLVVTPETIADQWREEICKHIKNVRIFDSRNYFGIKKDFHETFNVMIYYGVQQR